MDKNNANNQPQLRVAVVNRFFSHYRQQLITELIEHGKHHYTFIGDESDYGTGIKLAQSFGESQFVKAKGHQLSKFYFQFGTIHAALGTKYDVIVFAGNPYHLTTWIAAALSRIRGKRTLYWSHGWIKKESGLQAIIRRLFYKISQGMLLYGHRAKVIGISEGFSPDFFHVIYNSLDCQTQDSIRAQLDPNDRQSTKQHLFPGRDQYPVLINITRLNPYKKLDMLIKAASILEERGFPVNVLIVGEGEHKQALETQAQELGVHAVFTGALYEELELGKMLNASDCAVMPGPIGLLVMHALAYGVPLITNDNLDSQMPEVEAILPGLTGDLFKDNDVNDLADTIERFLSTDSSYEDRYNKSREIIERFYNPFNQTKIFDRAVEGAPANDLFAASLKPYSEQPAVSDSKD